MVCGVSRIHIRVLRICTVTSEVPPHSYKITIDEMEKKPLGITEEIQLV
jgi:hypothetical protein